MSNDTDQKDTAVLEGNPPQVVDEALARRIKRNMVYVFIATAIIAAAMMYKLFMTQTNAIIHQHDYIYEQIQQAKQLDPTIGQSYIDATNKALSDGEITLDEEVALNGVYKEMIENRNFMIKKQALQAQ